MNSELEKLYRDDPPLEGDPLVDDLGGPAGRVHDWRNHLGDLLPIWATLPREARMAAFIIAREAASNEQWE